jgi:hypothetical protein
MPALSAAEKEAKAKKKKVEEDKALAAREEARKYLDNNHCGPRKSSAEQKYVGTVAARMAGVSRDNTIDLMLARKAKTQKIEQAAKKKLEEQQNQFNKHIKPLPDGWTAVKDPSSDDTYYWNEKTNETSWTRPVAPKQEAQNLTPELTARLKAKGVIDQSAQSAGGSASVAPSGGLPSGWQAVQCPTSKDYYYWHSATGRTTWSKPDASTASAPDKAGGGQGRGRGRGMVEPAWVAKRKREA